MIWLSVNRDFFMWNLLRKRYEKVLLLSTANLWGDYRGCSLEPSATTLAMWCALWRPTKARTRLALQGSS